MSYGCFNRASLEDTLYVQDGWKYQWIPISHSSTILTQISNIVRVPNHLSKTCEYSKHDKYADPGCVGCKHRFTPEPKDYAKAVALLRPPPHL